jgi:DNA polymerase/3'-5' exonuclease PolX
MHAGVQLNPFLAQPDNWGLTLLVRTGSAAFSTALLARWKRRQRLRHAQPGGVAGRLVAGDGRVGPTPEEETVFQLLGMPPVPPETRSDEE